MNDIIKAMKERRSVRAFQPELPKKADLEQIAEAGLYAASGMGLQAVKTIVITNPELRGKLAEANRKIAGLPEGADPFYGAPAIFVVLADKNCVTHIYDGSLVMGNLLLAAHAVGLNGIWIHRAKEEFEDDAWKQLLRDLNVEGEWEGIGHCAVGYPACPVPDPAPRKDGRILWVE